MFETKDQKPKKNVEKNSPELYPSIEQGPTKSSHSFSSFLAWKSHLFELWTATDERFFGLHMWRKSAAEGAKEATK